MNKKLSILLCIITTQIIMTVSSTADSTIKEELDGYLKIFIPCHNVKSVSAPYVEADKSIEAFVVKPEKDSELAIQLTEEEIDLIAKTVYAESKGEPFIGKVGVASVILNRLNHPLFPKSVKEIIFQKNAFSCINESYYDIEPDAETYEAVDEALRGYDPTGNALYFYNPKTATCQWIKKVSKSQITQIGNHVFFR